MIVPGKRLVQLLVAWLLVSAALQGLIIWDEDLTQPARQLWWYLGAALLMVALYDAVQVWRQMVPHVERRTPAALSVLRQHTIELLFDSATLPAGTLVADQHPGDDAETGMPVQVSPATENVTRLTYRYRPSARGKATFGRVQLWLGSPFGLWQRRVSAGEAVELPVFPDFSMLSQEQLLAQDRPLRDQGARQQIRRGEGMEFHQLREYRPGDSLRQIDWKASARRRSLISREYQEEQNQQIIMLLDGGQRLAMQVDKLTGFDHALNACLLLAWNAVREGDRPGSLVFSGDQPCWVPPQRGRSSINRMLHALYPLHPADRASDYSEAASLLLRHHPHHSLIVLITQLQPDDEEDLLTAVSLLSRRHRVMIADVQLPNQVALRRKQPRSLDQALFTLGDAAWLEQRRALHMRLRHAGVTIVEAPPQHLAGALNRTYLALKRAGQI